jgi:hypothetical protein
MSPLAYSSLLSVQLLSLDSSSRMISLALRWERREERKMKRIEVWETRHEKKGKAR